MSSPSFILPGNPADTGFPHPFAEILRGIADGKTCQYREDDKWEDYPFSGTDLMHLLALPDTPSPSQWRVKPDVVNVIEVPAPERTPLNYYQRYFVPETRNESGVVELHWDGGAEDLRLLERGQVHLTHEAAKAHHDAIIFTSRIAA